MLKDPTVGRWDDVAARLGCSRSLIERRLMTFSRIPSYAVMVAEMRAEMARRQDGKFGKRVSAYWAARKANNNHKVVSIRPGPVCDVYDLSVPGTENFALAAGVFVHNSKDVADGVAGSFYSCITDEDALHHEVTQTWGVITAADHRLPTHVTNVPLPMPQAPGYEPPPQAVISPGVSLRPPPRPRDLVGGVPLSDVESNL
jgi:hypothetical protein